jgi:hypothetical protein
MPTFSIETTYHLPIYRQRTYEADTLDEACRQAIEDEDWSAGREGYETAGETCVSGAWPGADTAHRVTERPVPSQFAETVARKARHFEILYGVLKILVSDTRTGRAPSGIWLDAAVRAIAKVDAILAGEPDPDGSTAAPKTSHRTAPRGAS